MKTIEELENEIKNLSEELKKLKQEKESAKTKRWRAEEDEYYYSINGNDVEYLLESYCGYDDFCYEIGNYFQTREQAEKALEKLKIYTQLKDLALRLNKGRRIDFLNSDQEKYNICYTSSLEELLEED